MLEKNPQTVKLVFKNMPLNFHKMAQPAARAALAAREQGKFWEFHDRLFAEKKLSNEAINKIALDLKLDIPRFEKRHGIPKNPGIYQQRSAGCPKSWGYRHPNRLY